MIEVRRHLPSVAEYVALNTAVGWLVPDEQACERALAATVVSVGAFEGPELVGMGRLVGDGAENWVLVDIIVHPCHQGQGVGKSMIRALESEVSRRAPGSTVLLFCASALAPFYEGLGYEVSPGTFMKKVLIAPRCPTPAKGWPTGGSAPPGREGGDPTGPWRQVAPTHLRPSAIP